MHIGHEPFSVRAQGAGYPVIRRRPVPARLAAGIDRHPLGMCGCGIVVNGVGIRAGDDDHVQCPASGDQLAQGIVVPNHERAAVVVGDLRWVIGHAPAGAETGAVGVNAPEIRQPLRRVVSSRVVLHQRELCPAHRAVEPGLVSDDALGLTLEERWITVHGVSFQPLKSRGLSEFGSV